VRAGDHTLTFETPLVMGVVNVTPNSFSAGHAVAPDEAVAHGTALWRAGADWLDIGGEATNPRAEPVSAEQELARVLPVVRGLRLGTSAVISVDTTKASVARAAVAAGAAIINDISGGLFDPEMISVAAELAARGQAAYVCGHLRGRSISEVFGAEAAAPPTRRVVIDELTARIAALPAPLRAVTLADPGLGFGKGGGPLNLELLRAGAELTAASGAPVLVGPSRKRFLRRAIGLSDDDRSPGALAALAAATVGACLAAVAGGAAVVRVHDVALLRPALTVYIRS
jgi:dihydropteroate synthase